MEPLVLVSVADGVGRLVFNRPEQRNAMSVDMMLQLYEHLVFMQSNATVRCVVIQGAGGNFVAGGDVKSWDRLRAMSPDERGADFRKRLALVRPLILLMESFSKPIIAGVQGYAAGAGLCFVAAADFVLVDETAKFLFANVRTSLVPDMGLTYFLPRAIGPRQAARLSLQSGQIDAPEAIRIGLATEQVVGKDFGDALAKLTRQLSLLPATALSETKRLMRKPDLDALARCFDAEVNGLAACAATDDFVEALAAFMERRKPVFGR